MVGLAFLLAIATPVFTAALAAIAVVKLWPLRWLIHLAQTVSVCIAGPLACLLVWTALDLPAADDDPGPVGLVFGCVLSVPIALAAYPLLLMAVKDRSTTHRARLAAAHRREDVVGLPT